MIHIIQVTPNQKAIHTTYVSKCLNYVAKACTYVSGGVFWVFHGEEDGYIENFESFEFIIRFKLVT